MVKTPQELFEASLGKARKILSSRPSPILRNRTQSDLNKLALWYVGYLLEEVRMNEEKNKCQQT